jgi:hypothetical protein
MPGVGTDTGANHCDMYRLRCSLWQHGRFAFEGWSVCDLVHELGFLPDELDGPHLMARRSVRA